MASAHEDWDMCESILTFSGKQSSAESDHISESIENLDLIGSQDEDDGFEAIFKDLENSATDSKPENENCEEKVSKSEEKSPKSVVTRNPDCLYHGAKHRSDFQRLANLLRSKPKLLPGKYAPRLGKAVCMCTDEQSNDRETQTAKYGESSLKHVTNSIAKYYTGYDQMDVKAVLQKLLKPDSTNSSVFKLHKILVDMASGFCAALECPKSRSALKKLKEKENTAPLKIKEAVTLPLPNEYVPHFIGKKGIHVNALTQAYGVQLSVHSPCTLRRVPYKAPEGPNAIVILTASTQEEIDAAKAGVIAKSKAICLKREKHKQNLVLHAQYLKKRWAERRKMKEERRKVASKYSEIFYGGSNGDAYLKELDRDSHISKYMQCRKTGNTLRSKPAPVLEGSTCINCLGHYDAGEKNTKDSCRFHPGYVREASAWVEIYWATCKHVVRVTRAEMVTNYNLDLTGEPYYKKAIKNLSMFHPNKRCQFQTKSATVRYSEEKVRIWSCCKGAAGNINDKQDKHELHAENGCQTALHTWRPQRSNKGSNRVKEQGAGKKSGKMLYNMTEIRKGLKTINQGSNGARRKARMAIDEGIDGWALS